MLVSKAKMQRANEIASEYSRWCRPGEIIEMYNRLRAIGITIGMITNREDYPSLKSWRGSCEWYLDGEEVENSLFVYGVYEGGETPRNEYTIYFS